MSEDFDSMIELIKEMTSKMPSERDLEEVTEGRALTWTSWCTFTVEGTFLEEHAEGLSFLTFEEFAVVALA